MQRIRFNLSGQLKASYLQLMGEANFKNDARALIEVDSSEFESLLKTLSAEGEFFDQSAIADCIKQKVNDAGGVVKVVLGINNILTSANRDYEDELEEFESAIEEGLDFDESEKSKFLQRIGQILRAPGLQLDRKAEKLSNLGVGLDSVELICDIRPVFTVDKSKVAGAMPHITMILEPQGTDVPHMFRLTLEQLDELCQKSLDAMQKCDVIRDFCNSKQIKLPRSSYSE